jgi:protein involved in ribonucleotide reduction
MLNLIYFSNVSENTHRYITRLTEETPEAINIQRIPLNSNNPPPLDTTNPYILITPSYGTKRNEHVPPQVKKFLTNPQNRQRIVGVIGTGNLNFGTEYAAAATMISRKLNTPILQKLELSGNHKDIQTTQKLLQLTPQQIHTIAQKKRVKTKPPIYSTNNKQQNQRKVPEAK